MLCKVVLTFESVDEILKCDIQMKATEQYFLMVLFIMLHKVVLRFEPVDEILKCYHSNKISSIALFCVAVNYTAQGGFNFKGCRLVPNMCSLKRKPFSIVRDNNGKLPSCETKQ